MGLGPAVYLEITNGKIICSGIMGTAINANFSFGIPPSMSFKPVTASQAENPICGGRLAVNEEVAIRHRFQYRDA